MHRRAERAFQGATDADREAAREWAKGQLARVKSRPADYAQVREALGIPKAA